MKRTPPGLVMESVLDFGMLSEQNAPALGSKIRLANVVLLLRISTKRFESIRI